MLRSIAALLAEEVGEYCIVDSIDRHGTLKRLAVEHPDRSRVPRLDALVVATAPGHSARAERLLASSRGEIAPKVSETFARRSLDDVVLLRGEVVRSYMAAVVTAGDAPIAVLTLVTVTGARRYRPDELAFLEQIADFTGLAVENALRREMQPKKSVAPPPLEGGEDVVGRGTLARQRRVSNAAGE